MMTPFTARPSLTTAAPWRRWTCLLLVLCLTPLTFAEKPDPGTIGGGGAGGGKADPAVLGVQDMDPKLIADFVRAYDADFGPEVAVSTFVLTNPAKPNQRAVAVDTELLAAQVRRVWTKHAPDVEVTSLEAGQRNRLQNALAKRDNDPAGVAEMLALETDAELMLVIKCYPNSGRNNEPDFDVVFELLDLVRGELVSTGRGRWFNSRDVMPTEILARAITRDVWTDYVAKKLRLARKRNITLTITGLADQAAAQNLADSLGEGLDTPVQLRRFRESRDATQTSLRVRLAEESDLVAAELAAAAEFAGLKLTINSVSPDEIVARVEANAEGGLDGYRQWLDQRDPRRVRLLAGWSLSNNRPVGGVGELEQIDMTGADFVTALSTEMISTLAPISNTDLAGLQDAALADAFAKADEAALTELLRVRFPDEIIWVVSARPVKNGDEQFIRVTTSVIDTLSAQTLTIKNDDFLGGFDERFIRRKADQYVAEAMAGIERLGDSPMRRQTLMIVGLDSAFDRDLLADAVARRMPNGESDVKLRESVQNDVAGEAAVELEVKTQGDAASVSRVVRRAIFDELGWPVHEYRLNPAVVLRVKNALEVPEWAMLTGEPDNAGDLMPRVRKILADNGDPAVLSFIQAADRNVSADQLDAMQTRINEHLSQAGVRVLDSGVAPELAQRLRYNPEYQDDFSLAAVLRDQVRADWVLLGYARDTEDGLAGTFRLVDLRRAGQFLVGINVPDLEATNSRKVKVDREDPLSVARFVAGRTLGGLLRLEGQPHRLEVVVRGAKSGDQVITLGQQIATNIPAVVSVENLYFDPSAAGFFVVHRGKFENLAVQIDLVRDGLPFPLQDASFDRGVWMLTIDGPVPTGPVRPILPGQGIIVDRPGSDAASSDQGQAGKPTDRPNAGADTPGAGASSGPRPTGPIHPVTGSPDAIDQYFKFVSTYIDSLTQNSARRSLKPESSVNPGMQQPAAAAATELLVITRNPNRNVRDLSRSDATRRIPLNATRSLADLDQIERELKAQDASVVAVVPNYSISPFADQPTLLQPIQWALTNPVAPGIDSNWEAMRDRIRGLDIPLIAVVDTGGHINDPRVAAYSWNNTKETAGNGKDDDGNGLIDDVFGYHFADDTAKMYTANKSSHGTFCGSIIAGQNTSDVFDVMGVAPGAKIIHVGALGRDSSLDVLAKSLRYAVANGAKVINMSLGTPQHERKNTAETVHRWNKHPIWDEMEQAGVLLVISAGNDALNTDVNPSLPACLPRPNIISVMAIDPGGQTGRNDSKRQYSNYGKNTIDIAAPGSQVMGITKEDSFDLWNGTSMAAPVVSAVAGMVWAQNPDWDYSTVKRAVIESGRPVKGLEERCRSGRMVDAAAALDWQPDRAHGTPGSGGSATAPHPPAAPPANGVKGNNNVAVVVGVNDLYNNKYAHDLNGAVKDAVDMSVALTKFAGYKKDRVFLIADGARNGQDSPTRDRIMVAVKKAADLAGPDDMLLVTFSGHGLDITTDDGKAHTVLVPADFENSFETSVLVSELRQILNASKAGEKVLMIDACHAAGTAELPPLNPESSLSGSGIITLASCKFEQTSLEDPSMGSGVFTHWVIRGLTGEARGNDNLVTAFELFEFVRSGVPGHAERVLPGHKQNPVFHGTITGDFSLVEIN